LAAQEAAPSLTSTAQHLRQGEFKRIVLMGMGSSYHGLHPLNLQLIRQGFTSFMVETSELVQPHSANDALRLPEGPANMGPILDILPVQMITLALAARVGREAGKFEFASKITASE